MIHMKRKLTLLLMCLLLLGGVAMASSGEVETDALEEISEETVEEPEMPPEEEPVAASNEARDYINYYLMPGDSPYLEVTEVAEYIYTTADADNYEQIVFSAMDWNGLSDVAQAEVDAALPEGYLALLQEAVDYAATYSNGVVGSAGYVVTFEDGTETGGAPSGISVAEIIEEAGLAEVIYVPDAPALLADFGTDSAVRYNYGWWGGGRIYYGSKTGSLGPLYIGSPFGDAAATYITADLHTDYFYSSSMGAYYDCYCLSARSSYPKDKWVTSSGESKWNALSSSQRTGLAKAVMYGQYYKDQDGSAGAFSGVQCAVWSIMHGQMDERGRGTGNIYDGMHLYDSCYSACWNTFDRIRDCMWIHGAKPSFTYGSENAAAENPIELVYDPSSGLYTATLTDTSDCAASTWLSGKTYLEEYFKFSADGVSFSVSGSTLTISAPAEAFSADGTISVQVLTPTRGGTTSITIFDSIRYLGAGWQPVITNWNDHGTALYVYMTLHAELKDPEISTSARDGASGGKLVFADANAEIIDTVTYADLTAGNEYTLIGTVVDKATGDALTSSRVTFTPAADDGSIEVKLHFDATGLYDRELVVFEELRLGGEVIAEHKDLNDEAQTVRTTPPGSLTVTKYASDGETPLPGVGFALSDTDGNEVARGTTDENGTIAWIDLAYGDYFITEVSTQDGFALLPESIPITIPLKETDGTYLYDLRCTIRNAQNYTLPMTGGAGHKPAMFGAAAFGLALIAGFCYIQNQKRRKDFES